jgi:Tol biopolymer transport system component
MKNTGTAIGASSWFPDGRALAIVLTRGVSNLGDDIMLLRLDGDRKAQPLVTTRFAESYPAFSPDGRWLAYASDEAGRLEVYVQPFPGPGPRQQVSTQGGTAPAWSHDGRELFYITAETRGGQAAATSMMSVPVTLSPTFTASTPHTLFTGRYGATALVRGYDVTQDSKRFLMVQQKERMPLAADQIVLVEHWIDELKRR